MIATPVLSQAALVRHPDTPCDAIERIYTFVGWESSGVLTIGYTLTGALGQLQIPRLQSARRADELWRHTCFEAFVGAKNDAEYYEFNFSPSGEWAVYEFRDYRDGGPVEDDELELAVSVSQESDKFELRAAIRLDRLPGLQLDVRLSVGLSTIIEDNQGRLSYWALKHVPGKPDFHHPNSFALEIQAPIAAGDSIAYTAKP